MSDEKNPTHPRHRFFTKETDDGLTEIALALAPDEWASPEHMERCSEVLSLDWQKRVPEGRTAAHTAICDELLKLVDEGALTYQHGKWYCLRSVQGAPVNKDSLS